MLWIVGPAPLFRTIGAVSDQRFEFRGNLATTPLAEALETVHRYRVPGVLSLIREGIEKKIFLWDGEVIFATSGDREDSLGNYLLRLGRLGMDDFFRSVERLMASAGLKRHGDVLVEMGLLSPDDLDAIVMDQVREIVFSVFNWDEGEMAFQVGQYRTDEIIRLDIPTRRMILEGVKATRDVKRLVALIGPSWTAFDPCYEEADLPEIGLSSEEARLLSLVDGSRTLRDLIALGPGDAAENARLVYAFFALRLIARRDGAGRNVKIQLKTVGGQFAPD